MIRRNAATPIMLGILHYSDFGITHRCCRWAVETQRASAQLKWRFRAISAPGPSTTERSLLELHDDDFHFFFFEIFDLVLRSRSPSYFPWLPPDLFFLSVWFGSLFVRFG